MRKLHISSSLSLPVEAITQRISFLGRTGSGKTYSAGVLVEEALKLKQQVVVLDPKGDWWGLRSSADGKHAGLPITILGGEHADAPLLATAGGVVAEMIVRESISVILDLSLFASKSEECRFSTAFADQLYRKNRRPLMFVVDETDQFAPQSPMPDERLMISKFEIIARRGRKRGIGFVICSQRSAAIHKGVLSQTEVMVAHQTTSPHDKKAIMEWMQDKGTEEQQKEFLHMLPHLQRGEAIVWSPSWLRVFGKTKFRQKETFDSSATPRVGARRREPKIITAINIELLKKHMAATIEESKRNDPTELKREIQSLRLQLTQTPKLASIPSRAKVMPKTIEVSVLKRADLDRIEREVLNLKNDTAAAVNRMQQANARLLDKADLVTSEFKKLQRLASTIQVPRPDVSRETRIVPPTQFKRPVYDSTGPQQDGDNHLCSGELRILSVAGQSHPIRRTMAQIATLSGFTASGGTFQNYLRRLKRLGYFEQTGQSGGITQSGLNIVGTNVEPIPRTTEEILAVWKQKLIRGEYVILDYLTQQGSTWTDLGTVAQETGYTNSGGTFQNYIRTLKRNSLIELSDEGVRATVNMFPEEMP